MTAVLYCDNGVVAHTSPIYFIVDRQPTWDKSKAPASIQKQFDAILEVEEEEKSKPNPDKGILERLEKAESFYNNFLLQLNTGSRNK